MAKKSRMSCAVVGMGLLACLTIPGMAAAACNPGGNCTVEVTVGANCAITVDPDPLSVPQPRGAKSITWNIVTTGWVFAANGIEFKSTNNEFDNPEAQGNRFKWRNKHTREGDYEYAVNVVRSGPNPTTCSKDPVISNR